MTAKEWWVCSWCKGWFTIGGIKKQPPEVIDEPHSHGICRECQQKELAKIPQLILETTTP